ncbi:MAG: hypothetical protein QM788_02665 [Roseateles sp.]|uniref:hypothetical protein n=1 Tax=Roseateles sp. TaxID=1971397 RepID=UPI0039E8F8AD
MVDFEIVDERTVSARRVPFVSLPPEWCDLQLFQAAEFTLRLRREAVEAGGDLKDASAWNVIFDGGRPVFCDLLSFEPLVDHYVGERAHYSDADLQNKRDAVTRWIRGLAPSRVRELGCNSGEFSRLAAWLRIPLIADTHSKLIADSVGGDRGHLQWGA